MFNAFAFFLSFFFAAINITDKKEEMRVSVFVVGCPIKILENIVTSCLTILISFLV